MTDWQSIIATLRLTYSYKQIGAKASVDKGIVYRLAEGVLREPRYGDGVRLMALHNSLKRDITSSTVSLGAAPARP